MRFLLAALLACAAVFGAARADVPVPALKARVTDLTGTLSAQQRDALEGVIAAYETRRGSQIAVLLLPSTKPEEIEQYSIRVAEAWKIGRKGVDDGLILIVAKDDRRLRIEVGYGLEGRIPDSMARRVIDERITPRFKEGDFYGGVRDGVEQLIKLAEGETLPPPMVGGGGRALDQLGNYLVPGFILILVVGGILRAMFGRLWGSLVAGVGMGVVAWVVFGFVAVAIFVAILTFFLNIINHGLGKGSGWSSGSGGSSGGSSSSWGGGGGGSFGGGGSSGRW